MKYKLFISFTSKDLELAEEIHKQLNNAFKGKVDVFISSQSLSPGERWIDRIKSTLSEFDAILCLITPNSIVKQWIFVEWSAFWLNNKDIFITLSDTSLSDNLIQPIKETQYLLINRRSDIESLFKVLSEKSSTDTIPYQFVDPFIKNIELAFERQKQNMFENYLADIRNLPVKDEDKIKLATYCLNNDKYEYLSSILSKVRSDYQKTILANELIDSGQLSKIEYIYEFIRASQNQTEVVMNLIDNDYEDINIYSKLIDSIYKKDQTQLFNISKYIIESNKENGNLFRYIVSKIDNMAELRKVAWSMIDNNKYRTELFHSILSVFESKNRAELRKIGEYLLKNTADNNEEISIIYSILERTNKEQFIMLKNFQNNI